MKKQESIRITGRVRIITTDAKTGAVKRVTAWMKNLVVSGTSTGRNLIAQRLMGTNTYSLNITHGDIGTGSTAPANSDTILTTPSTRAAITSTIISANVATAQFFFSDALLGNGTYYEFGTFIDGTGTISTGKMFNHILFGVAYTKATGEDTTIEVQFTIT